LKKKMVFESAAEADEYHKKFPDLTRDDLDEPEQAIYDSTLRRLANPSAEQLQMLAAYSWAASELKKAAEADDQELAIWLRNCMIYARNGLGIASPQFISMMELLLDSAMHIHPWDIQWPPIYCFLKGSWELPESFRPRRYAR